MSYKVAVLGPIPYDHIITAKGKEIVKYGCVTHPTIALAKLMNQNGIVVPVTHVREEDEQPIKELLKAYPNINTGSIHSKMDQGDVIELRFIDQNNRLEKQTAFMPPVSPEDLGEVLDADVFVGVPISDYEVPLQTLRFIKEKGKPGAITIFDAHGPTSTVTTTGERLRRFWVERDMWLPYIDVLKMNIEEAGCSWFKKEYEPEELNKEYADLTEKEMTEFAKHVLSKGVKALYITLDERGCMVYSQPGGKFMAQFVRSVRVSDVVDTTGCGDSFAGGLAYGLLEDRTAYIRAAQYANALGALRTQGTTFAVFKTLDFTNDLIRRSYQEQAMV